MNSVGGETRRADRLLRAYPRAWRSQYGEEFHELLLADITECPRSWRRTGDVVRGGIVARLADLGLGGCTLGAADQVRASLASLGCCAAVFVVFGAAMWSQLTVGWQWSRPDTTATTLATVLTSVAMFALLGLAVLAVAPVIWQVVGRLFRPHEQLAWPVALLLVGAVSLFLGGRHFGEGWPGTGGHPWALQGFVPGGMAAFSWASTLSVTSYWAHPAALARFPTTEVVWMAVSPIAMASLVTGAIKTVRRVHLSPAVLRFETRLACVAIFVMAAFLTGACLWVVDGGPGPRDLFNAGAIDVVGILVMGVTLAVAQRAAQVARRGRIGLLVD
jgi:hypothetical protein